MQMWEGLAHTDLLGRVAGYARTLDELRNAQNKPQLGCDAAAREQAGVLRSGGGTRPGHWPAPAQALVGERVRRALHVRIIMTCLSMELRASCLGALQLGPQRIEFGALALRRPCGAACNMQHDTGRAASPRCQSFAHTGVRVSGHHGHA